MTQGEKLEIKTHWDPKFCFFRIACRQTLDTMEKKAANDLLETELGTQLSLSENENAEFTWTQEEETRLRHKIDWHTVPLVTLLYMLTVREMLPARSDKN